MHIDVNIDGIISVVQRDTAFNVREQNRKMRGRVIGELSMLISR